VRPAEIEETHKPLGHHIHDELVTLSAWHDNYGTFNNAEASRSNWACFSYWVWDLLAIEGEPGFNPPVRSVIREARRFSA
jgi:hypothetical protein